MSLMSFLTATRRAFDVNPKSIPPDSNEAATLEKSGIQDPTLRSFFAWRRSVMLFVVFSAVISAALASYREFAEFDERAEIIETLANRFSIGQQYIVPGLQEAKSRQNDDAEDNAGPVDDTPQSKTSTELTDAREPAAEQTRF